MALILIIEDRPIDREFLATVVRSSGHDVVETSDGEEALRVLAETPVQLIISDILMPTIDGYELVRRLREQPALASTPVVFYTAAYHEREARALADECGVVDVLTKPSTADALLARVDRALSSSPAIPNAFDRASVDREHLRLVGSTAGTINRFEMIKERMAAVDERARQIAGERDPWVLFNRVCADAREITLAQHAVVGLLAEHGATRETLFTSGFTSGIADELEPPPVDSGWLSAVVAERRPLRVRNPGGNPETVGLPSAHPRVSSLLNVPIASPGRVYGWLSLRNKLGAHEFTEDDEHAVQAFGRHAGIAYENVCVMDDLRRRIATLEGELRRRPESGRAGGEEERARLSQTFDGLGQALVGLKMDLNSLASTPGRSASEISASIASMLYRVDQTIQAVRTMADELHPATLNSHRLLEALEVESQAFERRSGIRCRVSTDVSHVDLSQERATLVLSIVQEAFANILRHGRATRVSLSVRSTAQRLNVSVTDNGRLASTVRLARSGSLGLIDLRERAARLGGAVTLRRRRPHGTIVSLTLPLAG
jgi:signal transduction histidine kinase